MARSRSAGVKRTDAAHHQRPSNAAPGRGSSWGSGHCPGRMPSPTVASARAASGATSQRSSRWSTALVRRLAPLVRTSSSVRTPSARAASWRRRIGSLPVSTSAQRSRTSGRSCCQSGHMWPLRSQDRPSSADCANRPILLQNRPILMTPSSTHDPRPSARVSLGRPLGGVADLRDDRPRSIRDVRPGEAKHCPPGADEGVLASSVPFELGGVHVE